MIVVALLFAALCYATAAGLAAIPLARPIGPPVRAVLAVLTVGVAAHLCAAVAMGFSMRQMPVSGLGPALSFAGLAMAASLLLAEFIVRDVTLSLIAAPLAAGVTAAAVMFGWHTVGEPGGARGAWLTSHVALSFVGLAALATAAAAGALYLVERRELKSHRFGSVFRAFPPLETLDRVNHLSALVAWVALTLGLVLAVTYAAAYGQFVGPQVVWGGLAWLAAAGLAGGRQLAGWRARRAAVAATIAFGLVITSYLAVRAIATRPGHFL